MILGPTRRAITRLVKAAITLRNITSKTAVNIIDLTTQMQTNLQGGLGAFVQTIKDPAQSKAIIETFAKVTGALAENWGDAGGEMD